MAEIYFILGIFTPFILFASYKIFTKLVKIRKDHIVNLTSHNITDVRKDIVALFKIVKELEENIKNLHEITQETQKATKVLFPDNFDSSKSEGKTVFIKNGEEKKYETIDWRNR